ncbi:MAG: septal ring lytic transglycosylase RlpA family protein [Bacteroides graminisolvens]
MYENKINYNTFVFNVRYLPLFTRDRHATYYHKRFHGSRTSDGGVYHKDSMTCAHRTYPLGTLLHVKNPETKKEVVVKVTDRGPYSKRLMIDLSYSSQGT